MAQAVATKKRGTTRKKPRATTPKKAVDGQRRRKEDLRADALRNEVFGIAVLAASLCLFLALASFHPEDVLASGPATQLGQTRNLIGPVGASVADIVLGIFGLAGFLLPLTLALPGVYFMTGKRISVRIADAIGYPILVLFCAMAAHLWMAGTLVLGHEAGGLIGTHGAEILRSLFGLTGAYIIVYAVIALTFILTTRISLVGLAGQATRPIVDRAKGSAGPDSMGVVARVRAWFTDLGERWLERKARRASEREARDLLDESEAELDEAAGPHEEPPTAEPKKPRRKRKPKAKADLGDESSTDAPVEPATSKGSAKHSGARIDPESVRSDSGAFTLGGGAAQTSDRYQIVPQKGDSEVRTSVVEAEEIGAELADPLDAAGSTDTVLAPALSDKAGSAKPIVKKRNRQEKPPEEQLDIALPESKSHSGYVLPPLSLLDYDNPDQLEVDPAALQAAAERLVHALKTFKIEGRVTEIHPGPVVTMFEFEPAPGVRISKIASLSDDLAMALKAVKVRIVAPIPGKGVVGFEVPNLEREMVFLKEIVGSKEFRSKKLELPIALGKDIHGVPAVTDLAKMPHLLVAGTTGSGKSVGVNGMITSLLYRFTPDEVRFIMVDPKMLELSIYEGVPHLLLPVVTDPKKASQALKWAVDEMDRRYELMMHAGVRNISGFNTKCDKEQLRAEAEAAQMRAQSAQIRAVEGSLDEANALDDMAERRIADLPRRVPYIVVVIDEFADLMMVAGKEVEFSVARIAQKARAAGIHLILATQRPSTDVITGVIKANFPTRMAFRVSSGIDSRTILSSNGAENLLGKGDMLFMPPGSSTLKRVHGAYVSEDEIHKIVSFITAQGEPEYLDESVLDSDEKKAEDGPSGDVDSMYEEAVRVVARDGRASTSHLQRRLSLGYNRAARIVDQMERDGLVGGSQGAKPRTVNKQLINELVSRWDGDI